MANYSEDISFKQGSDTGTADAASIQPVATAEVVWPGVTNRPVENLRARTEILRRALQDAMYYADYDRALILRSNAIFTLTEPEPNKFALSSTLDLYVYPSLTPGVTSGGRWLGGRVFVNNLPYAGTPGSALILTASSVYTGQRGYYDADTLATVNSLTLGANRITVDLVADPAVLVGTFNFSVTQDPATKVTLSYGTSGGTPTLAALISAINADTTSMGSYGIAHILRASTDAISPGAVFPTPFINGIVQGAYDAEAHLVTASQMAVFFSAVEGGLYVNRMINGEGLAIGYPLGPVERGPATPKGGRRQSIFDLPTNRSGGNTNNITPTVGNTSLFNTGREPEKIPGAVPIGKMVNGEFVFIDGTRVGVGESIRLGESRSMLAALASTTVGSSGALLVGFAGSGPWNADASVSNTALPAGTVEAALDNVVTHLGATAANTSGSRRIGWESLPGVGSAGNVALSLTSQTSIRQAVTDSLNTLGATGVAGGINARVSEFGHRMHGAQPIEKLFSETSPEDLTIGGAQLVRGELNVPASGIYSVGATEEQAYNHLQPLKYTGANPLQLQEDIAPGVSGIEFLKLSAMTAGSAVALRQAIVVENATVTPALDLPLHAMAKISGSPAQNGYYYVKSIDSTLSPPEVRLTKLNGGPPNFSTLTAGAKITFFRTSILGSDFTAIQNRRMAPTSTPGPETAIFGGGEYVRGYNDSGRVLHSNRAIGAYWNQWDLISMSRTGAAGTSAVGGLNRVVIGGLTGITSDDLARVITISGAVGAYAELNGDHYIIGTPSGTTVEIYSTNYLSLGGAVGLSWAISRDAARRTNNILITDDVKLLRGVQTGTRLDATLNHHHNSVYTGTYLPVLDGFAGQVTFFNAGVATITLDALPDLTSSASALSYVPANTTLLGFLMEAKVVVQTAIAASGNPWVLAISTSPGMTLVGSDIRKVVDMSGHIVATGAAETYTVTQTVLVKTDTLGQAAFGVSTSSNVTLASSTLTLRAAGLIVQSA
jgi:hypothetical protein